VIGELLPGWVGTAEWLGADPPPVLAGAEAAAVAGAGPGRRAEFATGRACARAALARLGGPAAPIPRRPDRGPQWPAGFAGSITHCPGYRAAAAARTRDLRAIGIDAEPHQPLPERVRRRVLLPAEQRWCRRQPPGVHFDRIMFSVKESVFKAWHPLTGRWLGFRDAEVSVCPAAGRFSVTLLVPAPDCLRRGLAGRFRVAGGRIVTATVVPRDQLT
jgi:4'-phosphopantetheinyl transferase EntD